MIRSTMFVVSLLSLFAIGFMRCDNEIIRSNIQIIQNWTEYQQSSTNIKFQPLVREELARGLTTYRLGNRTKGKK